jgi:hypothetical protein
VYRYHSTDHTLRGIASVAGMTDNDRFSEMNRDRVDKVMRPKVGGALNLHHATKKCRVELDFFLMTSAITAATRNFSQTNYVAANMFLLSTNKQSFCLFHFLLFCLLVPSIHFCHDILATIRPFTDLAARVEATGHFWFNNFTCLTGVLCHDFPEQKLPPWR